ncbi:MAG: BatD family protein, partial [Desulfofustis sp.]|nr:BatD family protein [Desulfofustis sp.]
VPRLSSSEGLKSYTPTATLHQGKKIFEQAVVVTDPAVHRLPPLIFSFFDPQRRNYQTITTDPIELTVTSPAATLSSATGQTLQQSRQRPEPDQPGSSLDELAPVKLTQTPPDSFVPLFLTPGFIIALATALLAIVGVSALRLHRFLQNRRPEMLRSRAIERRRQETLKLIDQAGAAASADYLVTVRQAVRSFLALCWQTGADALTTADIDARLGNDSPIYTLFLLTDGQAYGALALEERQRCELHDTIRTFIANCQ